MTTPRLYESLAWATAIAFVRPMGSTEWVWRYRNPYGTVDYPQHVARSLSEFKAFMASEPVPFNWHLRAWM
jgi:hypothetical protein